MIRIINTRLEAMSELLLARLTLRLGMLKLLQEKIENSCMFWLVELNILGAFFDHIALYMYVCT
jgi:hypothetical protein